MNPSSSSPQGIDFVSLVARDVGAVLARAGFQHSRPGSGSVIFESDVAQMEVYHALHSCEIGLYALCLTRPDRAFSLSELLRFWKHPDADAYRNFVARDSKLIVVGIQRLCALLSELLSLGMRFDQTSCSELLHQQRRLAETMASDVSSEQARRVASVAWAQKDYAGVILALTEVQNGLTALELRRLEYARKHVPAPGSQ
jgi:hypothetical protein